MVKRLVPVLFIVTLSTTSGCGAASETTATDKPSATPATPTSKTTTSTSKAPKEQPTSKLPMIEVNSPAVHDGVVSSSGFPCRIDGAWLPLNWTHVPPETAEFVIMTTRFRQSTVNGSGASSLEAVSLQRGVPRGRRRLALNDREDHKSIQYFRRGNFCPSSGKRAEFFIQLFAMPQHYPDLRRFKGTMIVDVLFRYALGRGTLEIDYE
jgi:hypothetical protein